MSETYTTIQVKRRMRELLDQHGLTEWRCRLNTNKSRLGVCKYRKQRIEVQEWYALNNPKEEVDDTILHEIAHALVGPGHGHGPVWKAKARQLGCTPKSCGGDHVVTQQGKWQSRCPGCNRLYHMHRQPKPGQRSCRKCGRDRGKLPPFVNVDTGYAVALVRGGGLLPPSAVAHLVPKKTEWRAQCPCCKHLYKMPTKPKFVSGMWCQKPTCGKEKGQVVFREYTVSTDD